MKLLLVLLVLGYTSASVYDAFDEAADELVRDFMIGMNDAPSLKRALVLADDTDADGIENDIKDKLARRLREVLEKIIQKIKDAIEKGKVVKEELFEKLKELKEKVKNEKAIGDKAKDLYEKIKEKAKDFLKKILENLGDDDEKAFSEANVELADFNILSLLKKLKELIDDKIDKNAFIGKIEKIFGKGSELADQLLSLLKEKGEKYKQKILDFIDRILDEEEARERRSMQELWEKVKNYFKDLNIDLKEKFMKFGEWVKETFKKGLENTKDKMSNIKAIAGEFVKHTKDVSKEVAVEALEFLRPYKDDLGELWVQVKEAVKEVLRRKD